MLLLMGFASAYVLALDASQMMIWDEAEYASLGRSLANDGAFTITGDANYYRLPVVPMSSAVAQSAFGDRSNFVARLPTPIFAIACLAWIYFVVARVYDGWSALLAVCLLGSFPAFAESTGRLMTEIPFMFFNTMAISVFVLGFYDDRRWFLVCWAAVGMAFLTRYNAVLLGPMFVLLSFVVALADRERLMVALRSRVFWLSPLIAIAFVFPWLVRQFVQFGDALVGFRYAANQIPNYGDTTMPWTFYWQSLPDMLSWPWLVVVTAGLIASLKRADRFAICMLCCGLVAIGWVQQYGWKEPRLIMATLPVMAMIGAPLLGRLILPLLKRSVETSVALGVVGACVAIVIQFNGFQAYQFLTKTESVGYPSFTRATAWLEQNTPADAVVMGTNSAQLHWHTGRPTRGLPGDEDKLGAALEQADWVVVVDYSPGQPLSALRLLTLISAQDYEDGNAKRFGTGRPSTTVIRAATLRARY